MTISLLQYQLYETFLKFWLQAIMDYFGGKRVAHAILGPPFLFWGRKESFNTNVRFYVHKMVKRIMSGNGTLHLKIYTLQREMH